MQINPQAIKVQKFLRFRVRVVTFLNVSAEYGIRNGMCELLAMLILCDGLQLIVY
jgi:hypothetical protein